MTTKNTFPNELGILPLRNDIFFPNALLQLTVGRPRSVTLLKRLEAGEIELGIVAQRDPQKSDPSIDDLFKIGTRAKVISMMPTATDRYQLLVKGLERFELKSLDEREGHLIGSVECLETTGKENERIPELAEGLRQKALEYVDLRQDLPSRAKSVLGGLNDPDRLADFIAAHLDLDLERRQEVLEALNLIDRLQLVLGLLVEACQELQITSKTTRNIESERSRHQREQFLRSKMKAIREELGEGEDDGDLIDELEARLRAKNPSEAVLKVAAREFRRLRSMPSSSAEHGVIRNYLEWLADMPWNEESEDCLDLERAQAILDRDHFGLEKPKKRLLQFLAVQQLKKELKGPILCLVGPPGVGKSSLAKSMAEAMGRNFARIALGGVRDEAEIRGHRRTYVGAFPGRIAKAMKQAGTMNPLILLDEVDKLSNDFRGDPASALLEVLDPEQNQEFADHYLDVPLDLSKVLFVATVNRIAPLAPALKDRLEVLEVSSYTHQDKEQIAQHHLIPRQRSNHGLNDNDFELLEGSLARLIDHYTREAGVRQLDRELASICREAAIARVNETGPLRIKPDDLNDLLGPRKYHSELPEPHALPGLALGLAWTQVGGEILHVEVTDMAGTGKLKLTGQLGDVMKESGEAALSYLRSHAIALGLSEDAQENLLEKRDLHIHFPAGATPKDGPSAGVAMYSAILSLLRSTPLPSDLAMTGEISLRGRVLPVGGIREKVLAAHRAGLPRVLLPRRNEKDLSEIPEAVLKELTIHFVDRLDEVTSLLFDQALPNSLDGGTRSQNDRMGRSGHLRT